MTVEESLPPIVAELDPRIAPLVHALRRDGFRTIGSCDGHGNARVTPWVQIEWPVTPWRRLGPVITVEELREAQHLVERLLHWFSERNAYANVCLVVGNYGRHEGADEPNLCVRVEVFDDLVREAFTW